MVSKSDSTEDKQDSARRNQNRSNRKPNDQNGRGNGDKSPRRRSKTLALWVVLILLTMVLVQIFNRTSGSETLITYTEFRQHLQDGNIEYVTFIEKQLKGRLRQPSTKMDVDHQPVAFSRFKVFIPFEDPSLLEALEEHNVVINVKPQTSHWTGYLLNWLPWVLIFAFWLFIFRQMQGGQKGIFSFGKSRARLLTGDRPKVTFNDVAGVPEAKKDLQEIIEFLKDPARFQKLGGRIPKGALLLGPPGTGKTLLAKAVAGEAGVPFFSMSGSDFVEMFVGVGASRVRDLFEQAKKNAPCIVFIDEMDAVGRHRGAGLGGGHDEREQTLNQLLVEMDGFDSNDGVILIAATNRPDVLDPALLRPGRFDRQIVVDRPDIKGREMILKIHVRNQKIPMDPNVKLDTLARATPGMSGADLANLINEAALLAARNGHKRVTQNDFEEAKDKIMMGAERTLVMSEKEKRIVAYHEAGHALLFALISEIDQPYKATIVPRGMGLGVTLSLPEEERHLWPKSYCMGLLTATFGGRTAEQIIFKEFSSGAQNDIEQATNLSRRMVCDWGMSEKLGPMAMGKKNEEIFLGRDISYQKNYSEQTAITIDGEIRRFIHEAEQTAEKLIRSNIDKLHKLAHALLEYETLVQDEVQAILENGQLTPEMLSRRKFTSTSEDGQEQEEASEPISEITSDSTGETGSQTQSEPVIESSGESQNLPGT